MGGNDREVIPMLGTGIVHNGLLDDQYGSFFKRRKGLLNGDDGDDGRRRGCLGWIVHLFSQTTSIIIITLVTIMDVLPCKSCYRPFSLSGLVSPFSYLMMVL